MDIVLDTNVLVSALLSPFGAPAQVLSLLLTCKIRPVIDDRLLTEYRDVLRRSKFGFESRAVDDLLTWFVTTGIHVTPLLLSVTLPDPDDIVFLETAAAADAQLITGHLRHFPPSQRAGVHVISPTEFIEWWRTQG